jgi:hypothetical protein
MGAILRVQDTDLASLRDDKDLAKLPATEQKDWRQFWAVVRALEKQARASLAAKK